MAFPQEESGWGSVQLHFKVAYHRWYLLGEKKKIKESIDYIWYDQGLL